MGRRRLPMLSCLLAFAMVLIDEIKLCRLWYLFVVSHLSSWQVDGCNVAGMFEK